MPKGIELRGTKHNFTRIDIYYLNKTHYLVGHLTALYAYQFYFSSNGRKKILLPQPKLSSLLFEGNAVFDQGEEHMYDVRKHGAPQGICTPRRHGSGTERTGPSENATS